MIVTIAYSLMDNFREYVDSRTSLLGLAIIEICLVSIAVYPFLHKNEWHGIKGYFTYLENMFF